MVFTSVLRSIQQQRTLLPDGIDYTTLVMSHVALTKPRVEKSKEMKQTYVVNREVMRTFDKKAVKS